MMSSGIEAAGQVGPCRTCGHADMYPADIRDGHERRRCSNHKATAYGRVIRGIDQVRAEGCYKPADSGINVDLVKDLLTKEPGMSTQQIINLYHHHTGKLLFYDEMKAVLTDLVKGGALRSEWDTQGISIRYYSAGGQA